MDTPSAILSAEGSALGIRLLDVAPATIQQSDLGQLYGNVSPNTDTVVQTTEAGVRFLSIMYTSAAPAVQDYFLDLPNDATLTETEGGYLLNDAAGAIIGAIEAPWAKDATGRLLPTVYELQGSFLTQRTDTTGAAYPIVVDPKVTFGRGVYLNMWGTEVRAYATAIVAVIGTGVAISCTLIGRLPNQILRSLATLICGSAAISLRSVFDAIVRYWPHHLHCLKLVLSNKDLPDSCYEPEACLLRQLHIEPNSKPALEAASAVASSTSAAQCFAGWTYHEVACRKH